MEEPVCAQCEVGAEGGWSARPRRGMAPEFNPRARRTSLMS